ncbi:MAG: hypothetical protein ABF979_06625 [Gluconobacter sp.]|uniref:hypothetical protein n=1 Tax=Gluconobacter sp. TaxID=1876758 RepID=UPI0039E92B56
MTSNLKSARHLCAAGKLRMERERIPARGKSATRGLPAAHSTHHQDALPVDQFMLS